MTENKYSTGLDFATRAIPYLEKSGNAFGHMEAHLHQGVFLYMLNRLDTANLVFEKALAIGKENVTPQVISARSNAHYQISLLKNLAGWPKIGAACAFIT